MLLASAKGERLGEVPCVGDSKRGSKGRHISASKQQQVVGRDRIGGSLGSVYLFFALLAVGLLGPRQVLAQEQDYVEGGEVLMACGTEHACSCNGTSGDGVKINVFDYPTSGKRIASVDDSYSEILETSCGTEAIAAGDTLYTLSDVELTKRKFDVVSMSTADCADVDIDKPADCYRGETFPILESDVELDVTICFCKHVNDDGDFKYKSKVTYNVSGTDDVELLPDEALGICSEFDFISQLATFVVEGLSHYYNFELDVPDEDTSSLSVEPAPPSSAGAFLCGVEPTPSPVETTPPTEQPTPSLPTPSMATTAPITPSPLPASLTPAPTPETTKPSSMPDTPLQTSAPVLSPAVNPTLAPSVGSTPDPTPTTTVPEPSSGSTPVAPTVFPTGAPIDVKSDTVAPTATESGTVNSTNTNAPSNSGGSLSPAPTGVTTEPSPAANISDVQRLNFTDEPLRVKGAHGVALAALGVLSVLTFLPTWVK